MSDILKKFIEKYGEELGIKNFRYNRSLECCILKYGEETGRIKYNNWKNNVKLGTDKIPLERKIEIRKKTSSKLKGRKSSWHNTLEDYIRKYGESEGTIRYNKFKEITKQNSLRGEKIITKMRYINSLKYYIDKYGEEEGNKRYNEWCKSQDHSSLLFFIKKYGEEEGTKKYIDTNLKKNLNRPSSYFSKVSQVLFKDILKYLPNKEDCFFATHQGEFKLYYTENGIKNRYCYDFIYQNKIIEYNGDWFHRNPKYYDKNDPENIIIVERDAKKLNFAKNRGYSVLIIWDSEYKVDSNMALQKCLNYLLND